MKFELQYQLTQMLHYRILNYTLVFSLKLRNHTLYFYFSLQCQHIKFTIQYCIHSNKWNLLSLPVNLNQTILTFILNFLNDLISHIAWLSLPIPGPSKVIDHHWSPSFGQQQGILTTKTWENQIIFLTFAVWNCQLQLINLFYVL